LEKNAREPGANVVLALTDIGEVNDHPVHSTGWLEFLRSWRRKAKARQCFKRCTCNRVRSTRFVGQEIIGFGVLTYPGADERWAKLNSHIMMEVQAIEVSRDWRSAGVGRNIIEMLMSYPQIEEKIAYMVGYSWTWDLDRTKKTTQQYRRMLIKLFEPFGFLEYQTNEPNLCLKSENIFMGRVGDRVSKEIRNKFKWLRFGIYT
jgi:hypothetical protein